MAGNCAQGPPPGLARDHPPTLAADPSQERRGTTPKTLRQEWRGTNQRHQQETPARNGGELCPGPSARAGEGPPADTQHTHAPKHPPTHTTPKSTPTPTPRTHTASENTHTPHTTQYANTPPTPAREDAKQHPRPSARIGKGPPTNPSSRPQPGMAGNCTQNPPPGLARDHPTVSLAACPARKSREQRPEPSTKTGGPAGKQHLQGPPPQMARTHPPTQPTSPLQEWREPTPRNTVTGHRPPTQAHGQTPPPRTTGDHHAMEGQQQAPTRSSEPRPRTPPPSTARETGRPESCLLVLICAVDCNPTVQLIDICMPV